MERIGHNFSLFLAGTLVRSFGHLLLVSLASLVKVTQSHIPELRQNNSQYLDSHDTLSRLVCCLPSREMRNKGKKRFSERDEVAELVAKLEGFRELKGVSVVLNLFLFVSF